MRNVLFIQVKEMTLVVILKMFVDTFKAIATAFIFGTMNYLILD